MSNLLTDDELQEIREGSERFGEATLEETRQLFDHIAALKSDLELLVKVSCREQRYKCADCIENRFAAQSVIMKAQADAQKAPCPAMNRVLELWQTAKENK